MQSDIYRGQTRLHELLNLMHGVQTMPCAPSQYGMSSSWQESGNSKMERGTEVGRLGEGVIIGRMRHWVDGMHLRDTE